METAIYLSLIVVAVVFIGGIASMTIPKPWNMVFACGILGISWRSGLFDTLVDIIMRLLY